MYINEAVKQALKQGKAITRTTEKVEFPLIFPTNTVGYCIMYSYNPYKRKGSQHDHFTKMWNPRADDLMANDWIVAEDVYYKKELE